MKKNPNTATKSKKNKEEVPNELIDTPIYFSTTFQQDEITNAKDCFEYSRTGNPSRNSIEKIVADLEKAKYGFAFSSADAAIGDIIYLFKAGDTLLVSYNLYNLYLS